MPYRHAHWVLTLLLAPLIVVAFWRDYFGNIAGASFAFHLHGATAVAWLLLMTAQSWTIHEGRPALHRTLGRAIFVVIPLFVIGGVFVVHGMAGKFVGGHPFYGVFGARLGMLDIYATVLMVAMVARGLRLRRRVGLHAGYMLATALLVFPPVMARLPVPVPPWLHMGEVLPIVLALVLASRNRRAAEPMLMVAAALAGQVLLFHTVAATAVWAGLFADVAALPLAAVVFAALAAGLAALAVLLAAWRPRTSAPRGYAVPS